MNKRHIFVLSLLAGLTLPVMAQEENQEQTDKFLGQTIDVGADKVLTREESTAAVSVITSDKTDRRSAKNIGNSIIGEGNGLISLQNGGRYAAQNPPSMFADSRH
jgi:outer membrane receptor for ferrienterochelin and colicin